MQNDLFSRLKWKFPDRRSQVSGEKMTNEMHIDNAVSNKFDSNKDYMDVIWNLPPHEE